MICEVGQNLRKLREEKGISQNRLSKISGVSQSAISAIESTTKSPSVETVFLLAAALKVSVMCLLFGEDEKTPAVIDGGLDEGLVSLLLLLTPQELQRVQDFVSGLIASRTV